MLLPCEMFNHAGLYRETALGKPVETNGDRRFWCPLLDGPVVNAIELIEKYVVSKWSEQVFIRHAFRLWRGRNETLNDVEMIRHSL